MEDETNQISLVYYKYYSGLGKEKRNVKIISDSKIYFSNRSQFNDPFDTLPVAEIPTNDQVKTKINRMIESGANRNPHLTQKVISEVKEKWENNQEEEIRLQQKMWSDPRTIERFCEQYCILCLARSPLNKLMWSHYGGNHTGFTLEFDFKSVIDGHPSKMDNSSPHYLPQEVNYTKTRPGFQNSTTHEILFNKDDVWTYEDEHRIIFEGTKGLYPYDPKYLKSVFLGAKISDKDREIIENVVNNVNQKTDSNIIIKELKMSKNTYELIEVT